MKELFSYLCGFSVVTSIVILLAVLLRPVLKKGPSYIRCILWTLVFLRLLVPVGFAELPFSAPDFFDTAEGAVTAPDPAGDTVMDNTPERNPVQGSVQNPVQDPVENPAQPPVKDPVEDPIGDPVGDPVEDPVQDPVQNPVQDPVEHPEQTPDQAPTVQAPTVQAPANDTIPGNSGAVSAPAADPPIQMAEKESDPLLIVSAVWAAGVIAMLGYMLASNLLLRYRVKGAIVYDSAIRVIDKDCSPFVFGIFRPIIYIPASASKKDWQYIIAHEKTHIKRFDHVLKPLAFFVLCFYWFNPLVWAAYILLSKDIEYACDEKTVKDLENDDRKAYSLALLSVSQGENIVFAPPLSFGKVSVKERIKRVMNRKIPLWAICVTILICASLLVLTVFSLASGENEGADSSDSSAETELSGGDSAVDLEISVKYADPDEIADSSLFFDEQGHELVEIRVNKEVKNFKFIEVLYDADVAPYAGKALFEATALTPDKPFYAQTHINEGLSERGISLDENGETVCYRIMYDARGDKNTDLYLESIPGESPAGETSGTEHVKKFAISVDYADPAELNDDSLFFDNAQDVNDQLVKIWVNKEVKNFQYIYVGYDDDLKGYAGETIYELPLLTPDVPFYVQTHIWESYGSKGIAFEGEDGKTVYYRIAYDWRNADHPLYLESIRKNRPVTVYRPEDDWEDYQRFTYRTELTPENLVGLCIQQGLFPEGTELLRFEIKDGTGYLDLNAECYANSDLYHKTIGLLTVQRTFVKNYQEQINRVEVTYNGERKGAPFTAEETSNAEVGPVRLDGNGNVILSDPPTYAEILLLHLLAPETYRDPGEKQPETHEMIRLENGQWYQSYVASSFNCRFILLSGAEFGHGDWDGYWDFLPVGSAENAFLYNLGAIYDDPSGLATYTERAIAVRGTLAEGIDGYAYRLLLPDELIVCVEASNGTCWLPETDTFAVPEAYASLFDGKTGEVTVTGVVMRDENGVFYLKDVALYG